MQNRFQGFYDDHSPEAFQRLRDQVQKGLRDRGPAKRAVQKRRLPRIVLSQAPLAAMGVVAIAVSLISIIYYILRVFFPALPATNPVVNPSPTVSHQYVAAKPVIQKVVQRPVVRNAHPRIVPSAASASSVASPHKSATATAALPRLICVTCLVPVATRGVGQLVGSAKQTVGSLVQSTSGLINPIEQLVPGPVLGTVPSPSASVSTNGADSPEP